MTKSSIMNLFMIMFFVLAISAIDNCDQLNQNEDQCLRCSQGYILNDDGTCTINLGQPVGDFKSIDNCDQLNQNEDQCLRCSQGYVLSDDGTCTINLGQPVRNSQSQLQSENQFQLGSVQQLNSSESRTDITTTQSVDNGLNPNQNGQVSVITTTIRNTVTNTSDTSRVTNTTIVAKGENSTRLVVLVYPNCIEHSGNICIACEQGYILRQGLCFVGIIGCNVLGTTYLPNSSVLRCSKCDPHFRLVNGMCEDPNCLQFSQFTGLCYRCRDLFTFNSFYHACIDSNCLIRKDGACQECLKGYYSHPNSSLCLEKNNENCRNYPSTVCQKCPEDHFLTIDDNRCVPIIKGCLTHSANNGECLKCLNGLQTSSDKTSCIDQQCVLKQYPCSSCIQGFTLNQNNICIDPNCQVYGEDSCQQCRPEFLLIRELCVRPPPFCAQVDSNGQCLRCNKGFNLNSNKQCQIVPIENCETRNSSDYSICSKCAAGYYLNNQICVKVHYLCSYYQPLTNNCRACRAGSVFENGICRDPNCLESNLNQCVRCKQNHVYLMSRKLCIYRDPNCIQFNTQSACILCKGQYALSNGKCLRRSQFCLTQNDQGCQRCIQGYYLTQQKKCFLLPQFCIATNNNGECSRCNNGYYLTQLRSCIKTPENCFIVDPQGLCQRCNTGYKLEINSCFLIPFDKNCLRSTINDANICLICSTGYILQGNGQCMLEKSIQNCQEYNEQNATLCNKCIFGFYLFNNQCMKVSEKCASGEYDPNNGHCLECIEGFSLNQSFGFCFDPYCTVSNDNGCDLCLPSFIENQKGYCQYNDQNCQELTRSQCNKCRQGYFLQNGKCFEVIPLCEIYQNGRCVQCQNNYILQGQNCLRKIEGCSSYSQNNQECLRCASGYLLSEGICRDPNCLLVNDGECSQCRPGYSSRSRSNICVDPFCSRFQSGKCELCNQNFFYTEITNLCLPISLQNCVQYQHPSCNICPNNYIFKQGTGCIRVIYGCQVISENSCLQCRQQLQLQNNLCVDTRCSQSSYPNCLKCQQNYIFNSDNICVDQKCQQYSNGLCQRCQNGYSNFRTLCVKLPQFCWIVNMSGQCQVCLDGYEIINGQCLPGIPHCINRNPNNASRCGRCQDEYYVNLEYFCSRLNDQIINKVNNCMILQQNNPQICSRCNQGYNLQQNGSCLKNIINCLIYTSQNECERCADGYINFRSRCTKLPDFCQLTSPAGECVGCISGYRLNNDNICIQNIANCLIHTSQNECERCADDYANFISQCIKIPQSCEIVNLTGQCIQCLQQFQLVNNQCIQKLQNCRSLETEGICNQCDQGFALLNNICIVIPENCLQVNIVGNCIKCQNNFYLNNSKCIIRPILPNCIEANPINISVCSLCAQNYALNQNGQCRLIKNTNCQQQLNGQCQLCNPGYYLNSRNICLKLPNNCIVLNQQGVCSRCINTNYQLINGICTFVINVPFCLQSSPNNNSICLKCESGYTLFNGSCLTQIPQCISYSPNNLCLRCASNYYLSNNVCYKVSTHCAPNLYDPNNGRCLQCLDTYMLNPRTGVCYDPYCTVQSQGPCSKCKQGYIINDNQKGKCVYYDPNCQQRFTNPCPNCFDGFYSENDGRCYKKPSNCNVAGDFGQKCIQCLQNFVKNEQQQCVQIQQVPNCLQYNTNNPNICIRCSIIYYLDGNTCKEIPTTCQIFDHEKKRCQQCFTNYQLNQNYVCENRLGQKGDPHCNSYDQQQRCLQCSYRYYLDKQQQRCIPVNPLCKSYLADGNCSQCFESYTLRNGRCIPLISDHQNCKRYNSQDQCLQCYDKHYPKNGKCEPINPLCKTANLVNGQCITCYQGYEPQDGICKLKPMNPHCKKLNNNICTECIPRFYLQQNRCYPVNQQCKDYDKTNGDCLSCYNGYTLQNMRCILTSQSQNPNCKNLNRDICLQCYEGYFVRNGVCLKVSQQCKNYNKTNGYCTQCYNGYSLNSVGRCLIQQKQQSNCKTTHQNGSCDSCYQGWVLRNGKCLDPAIANSIDYCLIYDEFTNACVLCEDYYYLATPSLCRRVSISCATYDRYTGQCLSCVSNSYDLQNGECIQLSAIIQGCSKYQGPFCIECKEGYYYSVYNCWKIDQNCIQFDYTSKQCRRCANGLSPFGPNCQ